MGVKEREEETVLRVSGSSPAGALGSAISHAIYDGQTVVLRSVGAAAVNQAAKAVAIAEGMVAPRGIILYTIIGFVNVQMPDSVVTGLVFKVFQGR